MKQLIRRNVPGKNWHSISVLLCIVIVFGVCIAPAFSQEATAKDLRVFYQQNCVRCHGADGSAVSAEGKKLHGQDLTDPGFQSKTQDDVMIKTILNGKFFGVAMPSFKDSLTEEEVQRMVRDIIRKSKKGVVIAPETEIPVKK